MTTFEVDLLDSKATAEAAADIASRFAVTHVVHNAGAIRPALLPDVKEEDLQALTQLHLGAALTLVQATLPRHAIGRASGASSCCRRVARSACRPAPPIPPPRPG